MATLPETFDGRPTPEQRLQERERDEHVQRALAKVEEISRVDGLTGVANRRYFEELSLHEMAGLEGASEGAVKVLHNTMYGNKSGALGIFDGLKADVRNNLGPTTPKNMAATAPVGSSSFRVPSGRSRTLPSTRMTHSERTFSTSAKAALSGSANTCVMP